MKGVPCKNIRVFVDVLRVCVVLFYLCVCMSEYSYVCRIRVVFSESVEIHVYLGIHFGFFWSQGIRLDFLTINLLLCMPHLHARYNRICSAIHTNRFNDFIVAMMDWFAYSKNKLNVHFYTDILRVIHTRKNT